MTHTEALAALADHPHLWRLRQLCESPDPRTRDGYRALVIRRATGAARPPVAESLALARRMRSCPYRESGPRCGCSGGRCALRRGAIVSHRDCFDCLRRYPD